MEETNVYFNAGDVVSLRQDIPNKPTMLVIKKETNIFKHDPDKFTDKKAVLVGIRCRWFTKDGYVQEAIYNTKDLIKV